MKTARIAPVLVCAALAARGDALAQAVTVAGDDAAWMSVSTDAPDAHVVVKLLRIAPDGKALSVADGVVRLSYRARLRRPRMARSTVHYGSGADSSVELRQLR